MEDPPVLVVDSKPLTVAWTNIDVDRAEIIVLLVSRGAGSWHLHVQLHRVHSKNGVANVREKVTLRTVHLWIKADDVSVWEICVASSPGPFPAFQCCMLKCAFQPEIFKKLGMGLETRLKENLVMIY